MAAVNRGVSDTTPEPPMNAARSAEAEKLLDMLTAAKPINPDGFVPGVGMPGGGDIPKPLGLYTYALISPDVWPSESESKLKEAADQLANLARNHESASESADSQVDDVFGQYWTEGDGAAAAEDHYRRERLQHERLAHACQFIGGAFGRLTDHIGSIKRKMREAHDDAHREIEAALKANRGQPVGVGPIATKYRTLINGYGTELHGFVADETAMLGNEFKLAPPGGENGSSGIGGKQDGTPSPDGGDPQKGKTELGGKTPGTGTPSNGADTSTGGSDGPLRGAKSTVDTPVFTSPPGTSSRPPQMPQMPSLPHMPSTGGGSSPLSGAASSGMGPLSSLLGGGNPATSATSGLANSAANAANPAAAQSQAVSKAMSSAMGGEFGRGLAAGANAAGGFGPPAQPIPQTPTTPLAAPLAADMTPASAAPASASAPPPLTGTPAASTGVPASAAGPATGGGAPTPMTPYGSVLPPASAGGGAVAGASPTSLSSPPPSVAPSGPAGPTAPPPSFVPALRESAPARISRDVSMTDLESARAAVADLAAASSVVYPGLQWAVVVARGASGIPEMWMTSNEGAGYIPPGVFVPRAMPLAAGLDPDFDARWFGWSNPAETVLRAVQARGDAVSAIATTWPQESEMVREATEDVAIGVSQSGEPGEAQASTLTRGRSHRLETADPALYHELQLADRAVVDAYVRQLTQQVAFGAGPELSATSQAVARTLISGRWPSEAEWSALRSEYDWARLMAGSQRPGLIGVEDPTQLLNYQTDFTMCRRLETLVCWEDTTPADIVYAARAAGVVLPLTTAV
jgi:hypothetical protein